MSTNFDSPIEIHFCGAQPDQKPLSESEKMLDRVWPGWFVHHVAGLMAPVYWSVDLPIEANETREGAIRAAAEKADHVELERSLAYENAASTIDCNCIPVNLGGDDVVEDLWFDTSKDQSNPDCYDEIAQCLKYLEARGLIQRHATQPELVQVLEESEATR